MMNKIVEKFNPTVKDVMTLLSTAVIVTTIFVFPPLGVIAKTALDIYV